MTDSPLYALSTMWSQGNFKQPGDEHDDMTAFARKTAEMGYPHVEINYVIPPAGVEALLANSHVKFSSVHSPCPRVKINGKNSEALNLAATDDEERELAVKVARDSIDTAVRAEARYLVVHLGGIGGDIFDEEKKLRKMHDDTADDADLQALRKSAVERRREGAPKYFPSAKQSLAEIADYGAAKGVTIGLENRYHYHEFPDPDELAELLEGYPPEVAGFWIDIGHVEVLDRLGLVHRHRWLNELASRCVGSHVHDVDGLADHRAPGFGTADWNHYREKLPTHVPRVFEINQRQDEDRVANAIPYLRRVGILPKE